MQRNNNRQKLTEEKLLVGIGVKKSWHYGMSTNIYTQLLSTQYLRMNEKVIEDVIQTESTHTTEA